MSEHPRLSAADRARKASTRAALSATLAAQVGDVQLVKPSRKRPTAAADLIGQEMADLRDRADRWLEAHGISTASEERGEDADALGEHSATTQHLGRIVHTRTGAHGKRSRVVSPHTGKLLGEQG